jgi:hypothetical protein
MTDHSGRAIYVEGVGQKSGPCTATKACTVFARSNAGMVGSNPTQGMCVSVCVYSVFVLSCVYVAALRRADHSSKESYRLCKKDYETEEETRA